MIHLTPKEEQWLSATDQQIVEEIWERYIYDPDIDQMPYFEFYDHYQDLHKAKYGCYLQVD